MFLICSLNWTCELDIKRFLGKCSPLICSDNYFRTMSIQTFVESKFYNRKLISVFLSWTSIFIFRILKLKILIPGFNILCPLIIVAFSWGQKRCHYFDKCHYFKKCHYFGKWRISHQRYSLYRKKSSKKIWLFVLRKIIFWFKKKRFQILSRLFWKICLKIIKKWVLFGSMIKKPMSSFAKFSSSRNGCHYFGKRHYLGCHFNEWAQYFFIKLRK